MKPDLRTRFREYGLTSGTLGSTAGQTVMVVLLPVLLAEYAPSAFLIGVIVGGEGLFAVMVPYWVGAWSDDMPYALARRFGRRGFYLLTTAPLMAATLALVPFVSGFWTLAALAFVFFAAFHGYLTPLWALLVDAVPEARRGRVQGVRGALHSAGLAYGLVAGGLLFALWRPLPFLLAALLVLVATAATLRAVPRWARTDREPERPGEWNVWRALLHRPAVRWFLIANALWTGAIDGIRPYIFLFAERVLEIDTALTSVVLLLLVGGLGIGAVLIGRLGDRYGRGRLLAAGAGLTAVAMLLGTLVRDVGGAMLLLTASGVAAAALIALPYPFFASLVGESDVGRFTGLYVLSMGAARIVAPMLVGAAIDFGARFDPESGGYPLMWAAAGVLAALSLLALWRALVARPPAIAGQSAVG